MDINAINTAIIGGVWTNEQLRSMANAIKYARARLGETTKRSLCIGDNVNFNRKGYGSSSKTEVNTTGVVMKIAIKYVTVRTVQGLWKVPAEMLTLVKEYA